MTHPCFCSSKSEAILSDPLVPTKWTGIVVGNFSSCIISDIVGKRTKIKGIAFEAALVVVHISPPIFVSFICTGLFLLNAFSKHRTVGWIVPTEDCKEHAKERRANLSRREGLIADEFIFVSCSLYLAA